jgi:hypothetical protein
MLLFMTMMMMKRKILYLCDSYHRSMVGKTESTRKVPIEFEENAFSSGEAVQNMYVLFDQFTFCY